MFQRIGVKARVSVRQVRKGLWSEEFLRYTDVNSHSHSPKTTFWNSRVFHQGYFPLQYFHVNIRFFF